MLVDAGWVILFIVAIGILIASLPGYARFVSNPQFNMVDASPTYIKAVQIASVLASIGTACLSIVLSAILFRRKRNEVMAVFGLVLPAGAWHYHGWSTGSVERV